MRKGTCEVGEKFKEEEKIKEELPPPKKKKRKKKERKGTVRYTMITWTNKFNMIGTHCCS